MEEDVSKKKIIQKFLVHQNLFLPKLLKVVHQSCKMILKRAINKTSRFIIGQCHSNKNQNYYYNIASMSPAISFH